MLYWMLNFGLYLMLSLVFFDVEFFVLYLMLSFCALYGVDC